jgi:hypothetical protein
MGPRLHRRRARGVRSLRLGWVRRGLGVDRSVVTGDVVGLAGRTRPADHGRPAAADAAPPGAPGPQPQGRRGGRVAGLRRAGARGLPGADGLDGVHGQHPVGLAQPRPASGRDRHRDVVATSATLDRAARRAAGLRVRARRRRRGGRLPRPVGMDRVHRQHRVGLDQAVAAPGAAPDRRDATVCCGSPSTG